MDENRIFSKKNSEDADNLDRMLDNFAEITASTTIGMKGSWIEICIKTQTLRMYIKNKLYVKTPVVTEHGTGCSLLENQYWRKRKAAFSFLLMKYHTKCLSWPALSQNYAEKRTIGNVLPA